MKNYEGKLKTLRLYFGTDHILVGNGYVLPITHTDNDSLNIPCGKLDLKNNLVVSKIKSNLPFVSQLIDDNVYLFEFNSFGCVIKVSE